MKKLVLLLLLFCTMTGCSSKKSNGKASIEITVENEECNSEEILETSIQNISYIEIETKNPEDLFSEFGLSILLPEHSNWITNVEYTQIDETSLEIHYYDDIANIDCNLLAVKDGILEMENNDYDESREEIWQGSTTSGQTIYVKANHSVDNKMIVVTWEYNNYKFAIQGNVLNDMTDTNPIPKTALFIISHFE